MIVLEVKFVSNENDFVSMSADVLGKTRDMQALAEEKEFEDTINQLKLFYDELRQNMSQANEKKVNQPTALQF